MQATDPSGNVRTSTYSVNVSSPGGATFTHDENGNTTQKVEGGDTWVYVWDAENFERMLPAKSWFGPVRYDECVYTRPGQA